MYTVNAHVLGLEHRKAANSSSSYTSSWSHNVDLELLEAAASSAPALISHNRDNLQKDTCWHTHTDTRTPPHTLLFSQHSYSQPHPVHSVNLCCSQKAPLSLLRQNVFLQTPGCFVCSDEIKNISWILGEENIKRLVHVTSFSPD